ncbi:hypothetical protein L7F22_030240 [Adiantum nelumboides]|nr:hypothetical protein [Adiantum nelumboides]
MRAGVSCSGDAGLGRGQADPPKVYQEMRENMMICKTWAATVLVISLVSSCREARCSSMKLSLLQYGATASRAAGDEAAETPATHAEPPAGEAEDSEPPAQRAGGGGPLKALPDFLPVKLPPFPWWALPIPSLAALPWSDPQAGIPHFPILDNLFLLLKIAESCFNCTFFLSVDTPLLLGGAASTAADASMAIGVPDLSPANLRLLYYQVVPFRLPFAALSPLPLAFRIPSFLNGSYLLVTRSSSSSPRDNFISLNYQRLLAPDLFLSDSMVVHGISGFLAPFTLAIPF